MPHTPTQAIRDSLVGLLSGGDRRTLAHAKEALAVVRAHPERIAELVALTGNPDWLVGMRAFDLLEKLARQDPALVEPYKLVFIGPAAESDKWEVRLQVVRALPLFDWQGPARARATAILVANARHPQSFVRAWATDGLANFAATEPSLRPLLRSLLDEMAGSGKPALQSRARALRKRLAAVDRP